MSAAPAIEAADLTVVVGGRPLLHEASFSVAAGETVLLAGPSGCGKSTLLRLIGGLCAPGEGGVEASGTLRVLGADVLRGGAAAQGRTGFVFQELALFEGLTAAENVGFALAHRRPRLPPGEAAERGAALLQRLDVPAGERVDRLSGGQRQRVAIARAMAFSPAVFAYDEPTSGLDPALRDAAAALIRETGTSAGATTLVVTHDVSGLAAIADRVLLLDPAERAIREVPRETAEAALRAVPPPPARPSRRPARRGPRGLALAALVATGAAVEGLAGAVSGLWPRFPSWRWGRRFLGLYLRTVAGPAALLYFLLAGAVIGLVTMYFTFTFLPWRQYTEPLVLDDFVAGAAFGLFRILVPLLLCVLLAARAGAAISADVGTRVAGRQAEAMRSFGAEPARYLRTSALWAFLLGTPLLAVVAFLGARAAGAAVFAAMAPDLTLYDYGVMFDRFLGPGALPDGTGFVAVKVLVSAFLVATVAWAEGAREKRSPEEVARAVTRTVIRATAAVLLAHAAFALIEF